MKKFIIATHGRFAEGILSSLNMILGQIDGIETMNAFEDEGFDIAAAVEACIKNIGENDELIVLTDMFGGSVNNEFMRYIGRQNYHLVTGINLPMLLELFSNKDRDTKEMIEHTLNLANGSMQYCNATFARFKADSLAGEHGAGL
jgi:fructoselysine and glucoselysine-specific PTS system IIA component